MTSSATILIEEQLNTPVPMDIAGSGNGPSQGRVPYGNHAPVLSRNIKIENDQDVPKDDRDPYPESAGLVRRVYTPPTGSVPGLPVFESNGESELPNYRYFSARTIKDIMGCCDTYCELPPRIYHPGPKFDISPPSCRNRSKDSEITVSGKVDALSSVLIFPETADPAAEVST
ncbi:MAG: hypothetical protein LBJ20_03640 [Candidatus Methanoplasma sp.]|jgi:hypothetical protein|nr:hypothetical protein [Candidatus Methanoplasma sp.]